MKTWNKAQIVLHKEAGNKLELIKDEVKDFISSNGTKLYEADIVRFVKNAYKNHGLVNDHKKEFCIVAFGRNTKEVHYFTKAKGLRLRAKSLILLDIWGRSKNKNAPYADTTFMFYFKGKSLPRSELRSTTGVPKEISKVWKILIEARDTALNFLQKKIKSGVFPRGLDIDRVAHDVIGKAGLGHGIRHIIGHSLGTKHPHGDLPGINWREYSPLLKNVGYTIEPGIYLDLPAHKFHRKVNKKHNEEVKNLCSGDFGMRTEIDFYISDNNEIMVTTPIQKDIEIIH